MEFVKMTDQPTVPGIAPNALPAQVDAITSAINALPLETLQTERTKLDRRVGQLMSGGWTGVAAEQYAGGWSEWREGAGSVLAALAAMGRLVGEARVELTGTDEAVGDTAGRLHQRLGPT